MTTYQIPKISHRACKSNGQHEWTDRCAGCHGHEPHPTCEHCGWSTVRATVCDACRAEARPIAERPTSWIAHRERAEFGLRDGHQMRDPRGRSVGGSFCVQRALVSLFLDGMANNATHWLDRGYTVTTHTTRDGKDYGRHSSVANGRRFATLEEAVAAGRDALAKQRKRLARKFTEG